MACDEVLIPSFEAFAADTVAVGNESFGALVRAALWRATHGWSVDGVVDWSIPEAVAHTIAAPAVWVPLVQKGLASCEEGGYRLHVRWAIGNDDAGGQWFFDRAEDA